MIYTRKVKGVQCLFLEGRRNVSSKVYPYRYEARHSECNWAEPSTIEDSVKVNFWGSVLATKPLSLNDYITIKKAKITVIQEALNVNFPVDEQNKQQFAENYKIETDIDDALNAIYDVTDSDSLIIHSIIEYCHRNKKLISNFIKTEESVNRIVTDIK